MRRLVIGISMILALAQGVSGQEEWVITGANNGLLFPDFVRQVE